MAKSSGIPSDGEMASYDNASKRPHQWLLDSSEADSLPINKKHAPETPTSDLFSGVINSNVPSWGNTFCFQSIPDQFTERLFDTGTTRSADIHDKGVHSINTEKATLGRSGIEEPYSDHSFALSMSHTLEDPQSAVSYGGIRKLKVSQVKDSDSFVLSTNAQNYDRVDRRSVSTANAYRVDDNSMCAGLAFGKEEEDISLAPYSDNNSFASDVAFDKVDSNLISMGQTYNHVDESAASKGSNFHKESTHVCEDAVCNRNSNVLEESFSNGLSTLISFGSSSDDDANNSARTISSYEFRMAQPTLQLPSKDLVGSRTNMLGSDATFSSIGVSAKKEETKVSKKVQSNRFPFNVRSLLSTGLFDGVPVKYIAWSREKELRGVIKGSGYQCGCDSCDSSKVVNAYEFERHAGCKTKHPNNHIYFENGKTIYGIVQELSNTPQDMLFSVIPAMTGSTINQKSFCLWKESYLAATRELQRIYGKEEGMLL